MYQKKFYLGKKYVVSLSFCAEFAKQLRALRTDSLSMMTYTCREHVNIHRVHMIF